MILNFIWKAAILIIGSFVIFELAIVSPLILIMLAIYKTAVYIAPDVYQWQASNLGSRKILLCIDPTSGLSLRWLKNEFALKSDDQVILIHVIEPTEAIQIPYEKVEFDPSSIDTKDFVIPQYISEICHWLHRNMISYTGVITRPYPRCSVAETLLKFAQTNAIDVIIATASERTGT